MGGDGSGLARERSEVTAARSEAASTSRRGVLIGAGSVAGLAFVLVVIALVSFGRAAPPRTPVAEVVLQDYRAVVGFGGRAIDGLILAHGAGIHMSGDGGKNWASVYGGGPVNALAVSARRGLHRRPGAFYGDRPAIGVAGNHSAGQQRRVRCRSRQSRGSLRDNGDRQRRSASL